MVNERTRLLTATIQKLLHRGAMSNIQRILDKTHSADIASVLQNFSDLEAYEIFKLEPDAATRAEILSYLDNEFQKKMLERSSTEETTQLVNLMDSDDAADLLANLPEAETQSILDSLEVEDSSEVVDLMTYPEDSAGGIMSSDYTEFTEETTVEQVIQALQSDELENKITFYIYVLNSTGHLVGVVSLKQLLLSKKSATLKQLMHPSVISVKVDTDQEEVAQTVERYDFLSIPVVDENNKLVGVITVDDVIDIINEESEEDLYKAIGSSDEELVVKDRVRKIVQLRLPWIMASFFGSLMVVFLLKFTEGGVLGANAAFFFVFVPMICAMGGNVGVQSSTIMARNLSLSYVDWQEARRATLRELKVGVSLGMICGTLIGMVAWFWGGPVMLIIILLAMVCTMGVAATTGTLIPVALKKFGIDPAIATGPFVTSFNDLVANCVYFSIIFIFRFQLGIV